jgi:AcrR family transcriptional regulator
VAQVVVDHTDLERIEAIVRQYNPDTHPYTSRLAAELPAADWLGIREGVLRQMRARLGLDLLARAALASAVDYGWAEGETDETVQGITGEFLASIVGVGRWSTSISHRRDADQIVDSCYDLIDLAVAALRGEKAPKRHAQRDPPRTQKARLV